MSSRIGDPTRLAVARVPWKSVPDSTAGFPPQPASASADPALGGDTVLAEVADRAYQQGLRDGHARAQSEVNIVLAQVAESLADLSGYKEKLRREAEADLLQLALGIARRVLSHELSVNSDAIHALIKVALDKVHGSDLLRVRCHPAHHSHILAQLNRDGIPRSIEIVADSSLAPGGVVFETNRGNLDCSVDSQLDEIERYLLHHSGEER